MSSRAIGSNNSRTRSSLGFKHLHRPDLIDGVRRPARLGPPRQLLSNRRSIEHKPRYRTDLATIANMTPLRLQSVDSVRYTGRLRILVGLVSIALAVQIPVGLAMAASIKPTMAQLVAKADDLYSRGAALVDQQPHTECVVDLIAATPARKAFGLEEHAFQGSISALPATGEFQSTTAQLTVRFGQFDNFIFNAVTDVLGTCDLGSARVDLRIAQQLLGEIHRIAAGHGRYDWNPPSLDDSKPEHARCSP
jgi:hypothetical protein